MQKPMWHRERYQEDLQLPVSKLVYLFQEKQEEQVFQPVEEPQPEAFQEK